MLNNIVKIKDFAQMLGKPESTIRTWKRRGDIPSFCFRTIGCTVFVAVDKFYAWFEEQNI